MTVAAFTPPPAHVQVIDSAGPAWLRWLTGSFHPDEPPPPPIKVTSHGWHYTVRWNTLLDASRIRQVLRGASGPKVAVSQLEAAYHQAGYFLVGLRASGRKHAVQIDVIEGAFNELHAADHTGWFYRGLLYDPRVNYDQLLGANLLAQAYAARAGKHVSLQIQPGKVPGSSKLTVGTEPIPHYKWWNVNLIFGNYGNRYSNRYLAQASVSANWGFGLNTYASFAHGLPNLSKTTRGSSYNQWQVGASEITPWGIYGASYTHTLYRIGDVAAPYYPTGKVQSIEATGSQLAFASVASRLSINEGFHHVKDTETVLNGYYTLVKQRYDYLSLGFSASHNLEVANKNAVLSLTFDVNQGISAPYGTLYANSAPAGAPKSRFRYYTTDFGWQQSLPLSFSLKLNAQGQWSQNTLPSNQRWLLGGLGNLAAYFPAVASGDSGYLGRLTLSTPKLHFLGLSLAGKATLASGGAFNAYSGANPDGAPNAPPGAPAWQRLSDVELGVTLSTPWSTQVQLVAGQPLGHSGVSERIRSQDRNDLYFVLSQSF